tara:strand:+ start:1647 stop:1811 length:165 start_codon:yes stop_codon:yes gene_type:complete
MRLIVALFIAFWWRATRQSSSEVGAFPRKARTKNFFRLVEDRKRIKSLYKPNQT